MTPVSQDLFREALLDPNKSAPNGLSDNAGRPAGARFDVYRNNVAVSLTEALHTGFPVVSKLIGTKNMDGLAGLYLRAHPPTSPVLSQYGQTFPDFIASLPQLAHLGYLPDVARLELALRRSYHAADSVPVSPEALSSLPPETLLNSRLTLAPAVMLVRSNWPIYDIWRFNTEDDAPKPTANAQDVLVTRPEFDPRPNLLPSGSAAWLNAIINGSTIGDALELAQSKAPSFDLTTPLTQLLTGNALIALNIEE